MARLAKLMERADVSISLDSIEAARGLSDLGAKLGTRIRILLKINTGLDRVGILPEEALDIAKGIAALPGVRLVGILTHEGQAMKYASRAGAKQCALEAGQMMVETANRLRREGILRRRESATPARLPRRETSPMSPESPRSSGHVYL